MQLAIGANTVIPTATLTLQIRVVAAASTVDVVDVAAYALAAPHNTVRGDHDMIFYGQTRHRSGAIALQHIDTQHSQFLLDLPHVDADISKIAFTAALEAAHTTFNQIDHIELKLLHLGQPVASAVLSGQGRPERALILAECYRHKGTWKFRIVGQGFNGGLKPLSMHFGVEIADDARPKSQPASTLTSGHTPEKPVVAPAPQTPSAAPASAPKVSLSKVSLNKQNQTVSLEKTGAHFGEIRVNLNWNQSGTARAASGFFAKLMQTKQQVDLDLGCLYELHSGERGLVQALGNQFGQFNAAPYIQLSGDDRTGSVQDGEWMRINGQHWSNIKRIMIYAFIYEGVPNWAATDAIVTLYVPNQSPVEIALTDGNAGQSLCGVVMLENRAGRIDVSREVRYFSNQQPLDQHYGWGLRWKTGSKD